MSDGNINVFQDWEPDCAEDKMKIIQGAREYIRKLEELINEGVVYEVVIDTNYRYLGITRHCLRKKKKVDE